MQRSGGSVADADPAACPVADRYRAGVVARAFRTVPIPRRYRAVTEVEQLIARFHLQPLPEEGGWFARQWTGEMIATDRGPCPAGTSILYLITEIEFSALHRLRSD